MKTIALSSKKYPGLFSIVDDEDYEGLAKYKWWPAKRGRNIYAVRDEKRDGKKYVILMHRQIMRASDGVELDHLDHDGLHNWRGNIRECSSSQNKQNTRIRVHSSNFKGVSWAKREKRWRAYIQLGYKMYPLGYFRDEQEAARAYDFFATEAFGEFAHVNFPA